MAKSNHIQQLAGRLIANTGILTLLLLVLFTASALAETYYVRPSTEITLRSGQGTNYKILAIIEDGTAVEILQDKEPWVRVTTETGKEGWLLKRFLTTERPLQSQLAELQEANNELQEELAGLKDQYASLAVLHEQTQQELKTTLSTLQNTGAAYEKLKKDTADVIGMQNSLEQNIERVAVLKKEKEILTSANARLKASQNIKWFLAGSGTLLLGCIMGIIFGRQKKQRSSLY